MQSSRQLNAGGSSTPARRRRIVGWVALDATAWASGLAGALWARQESELHQERLVSLSLVVAAAVTIHVTLGYLLYVYRGRHAFGSFEEVRAVFLAVAITSGALVSVDLILPGRTIPLSTPVVGGVVALVLMLAGRYVGRLRRERATRPDLAAATPVLLFGAGSAAEQLVRSMLHDRPSKYRPVGLLDDDPGRRHLRLSGVPVLGCRYDLRDAVVRTGATVVVFAVSNASAGLIRAIGRRASAAGVSFKVLPSVAELLDGSPRVSDVRDVAVADLLGRHQVETDVAGIAGYLAGKRVLVTGAGGSIGSELCRQVHRFGPSRLMMLDHDESALHAVKLSMHGRASIDTSEVILADLRDPDRIARVFAERRPEIVFHAAALKHLPLLEQNPDEAVKSNVWGTLAVLDAARAHGVQTFVNISTDKAADPCSVLGYSKRITERLTAHAAEHAEGTYLSVRFGNVLGSRGSVLTVFEKQVACGGPITVTHPDVTRYLMTVEEAVQLVIQAATVGRDGEALVLEMGEPVRIAELARQMADQVPGPVEIVYTGLLPGEKLHEQLFGAGEPDLRPCHPLISHVSVPALDPDLVRYLDVWADRAQLCERLRSLCAAPLRQPVSMVGAA
ncbi:MAG TPA: nucleoside-diphosphate sugar epimerase/dehydratase [Cryptosporangiaceae bacterium]|nr:nucleoside-diphosphate sugar epimerase/dehydratase [Cryptosporangiaceae bacterium]